ncbi:MAG: nucleotidyl transferase AbiEii/AbiGii toxin family protein [Lentisphaerota bacterium]
MLYYKTISEQTLELLKKLQKVPDFSSLRLVGGTALALQIGHRKSIDIDLFGRLNIDEFSMSENINSIGKVTQLKKSKNINIYTIDDIKVDIVNYSYPWIGKPIVDNEIILADKQDIAAMKLAAITGRGTKKDFIDLYFLLKHFSLSEMLGFYKDKFADSSEFLVLKSLTYFDDAEEDVEPLMLIKADWNEIKESIKEEVRKYILKA